MTFWETGTPLYMYDNLKLSNLNKFFAELHHKGTITTTTKIFFILIAFLSESVFTAV